ncbi:MAG TPA: FixH family protein [Burkholderiales bacterium]|nr:FixH family protein [Burkholderiales bacterium]
MVRRVLIVLALAGFPLAPWAQVRLDAEVKCVETQHDLVYDCRILLRERGSGKPVSGAELTVGADMPSMPMAHNLKPVQAKAGSAPGEYTARIELEMFGVWALRLDVRKPVRDRIVTKFDAREPPR